jgi:hypothetical protein
MHFAVSLVAHNIVWQAHTRSRYAKDAALRALFEVRFSSRAATLRRFQHGNMVHATIAKDSAQQARRIPQKKPKRARTMKAFNLRPRRRVEVAVLLF